MIKLLRHATMLAQGAESRLKKYEGLSDDHPSVMQISSNPQLESVVMAIQRKSALVVNQSQTPSTPGLNWKADITSYKCVKKGHLVRECQHQEMLLLLKTIPFRLLILHAQILLDPLCFWL